MAMQAPSRQLKLLRSSQLLRLRSSCPAKTGEVTFQRRLPSGYSTGTSCVVAWTLESESSSSRHSSAWGQDSGLELHHFRTQNLMATFDIMSKI